VFAGHEEVRACNKSGFLVAVVGAMTNALVREAISRSADGWRITGQLRQPAEAAVLGNRIERINGVGRRCD